MWALNWGTTTITIVLGNCAHPQKSAHSLYTFGPISYIGSKSIWMSDHPGASFTWSLRSTASSAMHIWDTKLWVILHRRLQLCIDGHSECGAHRELQCSWWHDAIQSVVCHQKNFEATGSSAACHCLSNYLLQGYCVTVNITWVLFRG